ncbi:MAG: carnitine dehydratase [Deltaproteobacteria bacterium]|nr:carnitine dehydratase [Deltaproteobacteria bacterium]
MSTRRRSDFYREARAHHKGPLAGTRVVELTTTWAGPMCGCLLADFGADVIKVEHPAGEVARRSPPFLPGTDPPVSFMQATVNRNKRSLTLDLHDAAGRDLFLRLAASADVVVENFRPGTLSGWGIGWSELRAMRHDLVLVSISGYGQFGRDSDRVGYDPLAQAASGFLSLNGSPEGEPVKSPTFLGDDLAGLHGALAALAALHHRDRTGEGQHVDVALLDSMLFQSTGYLTLGAMGVDLPRMGNEFRIAAPANTYACSDGRVMAGVLIDAHWKKLARVIGRPELADDPGYATTAARLQRRDQLNQLLGGWLAERTMEEAETAFRAEGIPLDRVRSYAEAARDPHVGDREMLQPVEVEGHPRVPVVGPAAKFSRTPTRVRSGAPALGADTDAILDELGIDEEERRALRQRGVT